MSNKLRWVYDLETYPNFFSMCIVREDGKFVRTFEISDRKNETQGFINCLRYLAKNNVDIVGYNNTGFDYPILHEIIRLASGHYKRYGNTDSFELTADIIYGLAQAQIASFNGPFGHTIREAEAFIPQVDLFKIHHFDNAAKSTSLKVLQFNMQSDSIEDLPFPVGTVLSDEQKDIVLSYNEHDVMETLKFYKHSLPAIQFREQLSEKLGFSVMNFNDTKIGKEYFAKKLEEARPGICYTYGRKGQGRKLNQTKRDQIIVADCLFDYYDFKRPEFIAVVDWFKSQVITETKGVFTDIEEHNLGSVAKYAELYEKRQKIPCATEPSEEQINSFKKKRPLGWIGVEELKAKRGGVHLKSYWKHWRVATTLNVVVDGFRFDFGTGGIHGSIDSEVVRADDEWEIVDADVASMYPNIAIKNRVYPEHLSELFCDIYEDVYNQRKSYPKGTPENGVMKLALNGVYGDSNNKFGPFYDPQYTMTVTINGQLSLCLYAERLMEIPEMQLIQCNTDGVTVKIKRKYRKLYDEISRKWQDDVKLELEFADYSAMFIRDVNNYIAVYTNGKVKRKGAYQYEDLQWHQNHSALIVPRAAEAFMLYGKDLEDFVRFHPTDYDFMLRAKVDRSSRLVMVDKNGVESEQQRICRYFACKNGGQLVKIMRPLAGKTEDRRFDIDKGWNVRICNKLADFDRLDVDYDYYVDQARKLVIPEVKDNV